MSLHRYPIPPAIKRHRRLRRHRDRRQPGYEGKQVSAQRRTYPHAQHSIRPPVFFHVKSAASFVCQVALNDDVPPGSSHADFAVIGDGREVAVEPYVRAGEPRPLTADITGVEQ